MALFTIVMGNSFAAFPVIAAGVLVPLIVKPLGVNPAMAAIITLTAGSSGTLIYADGGQFQHRAGGAAQFERSIRGDSLSIALRINALGVSRGIVVALHQIDVSANQRFALISCFDSNLGVAWKSCAI
jgi:hypothetical protein